MKDEGTGMEQDLLIMGQEVEAYDEGRARFVLDTCSRVGSRRNEVLKTARELGRTFEQWGNKRGTGHPARILCWRADALLAALLQGPSA